MEYFDTVWESTNKRSIESLKKIQSRAVRFIGSRKRHKSITDEKAVLGLLPLADGKKKHHRVSLLMQILHDDQHYNRLSSEHLQQWWPVQLWVVENQVRLAPRRCIIITVFSRRRSVTWELQINNPAICCQQIFPTIFTLLHTLRQFNFHKAWYEMFYRHRGNTGCTINDSI